MRRLVQLALALVLAAGFLAYALWDVDLVALAEILAGADLMLLIPFGVTLAVFFALKAVRWAYLLHPVAPLGARDVAPAMLIGFAGNNVLPARAGEVLRVLVLARQRALSLVAVGTSVALERLLDMVAMLSLFVLTVPFLALVGDELRQALAWAAALVGIALVLVGGLVFAPNTVRRVYESVSRWMPERARGAGRRALDNALGALAAARSPRRLAVAFVNSLAQWLLAVFLVWLSLRAVGVDAAPAICVLVLLTTGIVSAAPSAPGFVGAIQAAFVLALAPFAVSRESAVAASVAYLVAQWVPVTIAGGVCFVKHVRRYDSVRDALLEARAPAAGPRESQAESASRG